MMSTQECETLAERFLDVAFVLLDQMLSCVDKQWDDLIFDFFELLDNAHAGGSDDLLRLRHTDLFHGDSGLRLDMLEHQFVFIREESDAGAGAASTSGSARPMNVGLWVLWGFNLDDQVD